MMVSKMQFPDVRVLLVERQPQNTSLYRFALEDMGFGQIMFATNTEEAMDQMYFNGPSLIILGDELFPTSLLDFMKDIRSGNTGVPQDVPVVVIATNGTRSAIEQARDCGVTEIVSLPLSAQGLRKRVCAALKTSREFIDKVAYQGPDRRRRKVRPQSNQRRTSDSGDDHLEL
jgi:DNA-binding response OmpR family regulator